MYRRQMKTIGYLGQIDKFFGVPATTRNWNTILAVVRLLKNTASLLHTHNRFQARTRFRRIPLEMSSAAPKQESV